MTLAEYLERLGESQSEFARRSGVPQSVVNRICLGGDARGKNWALIAKATGGKVTAEGHFARRGAAA